MTVRRIILQYFGYVGKLSNDPFVIIELMNRVKFAIRFGNPEVVRLLLNNGADPNLPFGKFETCVSAFLPFHKHLTKPQKPFEQRVPSRQRRHNPPFAECWR